MKLDPLFTAKENKLFKIEDNSQVDLSTLKQIELPWSKVELEEEAYNEELLAALRDQLKEMENCKQFAIIIPIADKPLSTPEQFELFTAAFNHTARRIKDCVSVVGMVLPEELTASGFGELSPAATFMDTLAIKHAQYIYFTNLKEAPSQVVIL